MLIEKRQRNHADVRLLAALNRRHFRHDHVNRSLDELLQIIRSGAALSERRRKGTFLTA